MILPLEIYHDFTCQDLLPPIGDRHKEFFSAEVGFFMRILSWEAGGEGGGGQFLEGAYARDPHFSFPSMVPSLLMDLVFNLSVISICILLSYHFLLFIYVPPPPYALSFAPSDTSNPARSTHNNSSTFPWKTCHQRFFLHSHLQLPGRSWAQGTCWCRR